MQYRPLPANVYQHVLTAHKGERRRDHPQVCGLVLRTAHGLVAPAPPVLSSFGFVAGCVIPQASQVRCRGVHDKDQGLQRTKGCKHVWAARKSAPSPWALLFFFPLPPRPRPAPRPCAAPRSLCTLSVRMLCAGVIHNTISASTKLQPAYAHEPQACEDRAILASGQS